MYTHEITENGNYIRVGASEGLNWEACEIYCLENFGTHLGSLHFIIMQIFGLV